MCESLQLAPCNKGSLSPFPDVRQCALCPEIRFWLCLESTHSSTSSKQLTGGKREKWILSNQEEREGNLDTAFKPREKAAHRRQIASPSSQTDTVGHFSPLLTKGGATPKSSLPKNSYTPFSTLTLIVPSILRNFQRTSTISQTWHAPELIPAPGMWRRERDTLVFSFL